MNKPAEIILALCALGLLVLAFVPGNDLRYLCAALGGLYAAIVVVRWIHRKR